MADNDAAQKAADKNEGGAGAGSIGERLRKARNSQGLTLEQIATDLRIEARSLAALERDDFAQIGVPVFVKGYLKQYALRLGLPPAELIGAYEARKDSAGIEIKPSRSIKMRDERQITFWALAILVLVVLGGLLAYWWTQDPSFTLPSL